MKEPELLLGDEAIALAAIHARVSGAYGYPGTPSTEILEYVLPRAENHGIKACWASNEKVAFELAVGTAFMGRRALCTMKHVGLNVAMDPFMSTSITGVEGGLVVVVADDPGMHSSQNEQDSRALAKFALMPCFEPSDQQECYDMTRAAFLYSEHRKMPVLLRMVTRLAHSRASIVSAPEDVAGKGTTPLHRERCTTLPAFSRKQFASLVSSQETFMEDAATSRFNQLSLAGDRRRGIIVTGIAFNYLKEAFGGCIPFPFLKIGQYPVPRRLVSQLAAHVEEVVVIEEGYPVVEETILSFSEVHGKRVRGKFDGLLPRVGELNPNLVMSAMGIKMEESTYPTFAELPARPPALCRGCPHADAFNAIQEVLQGYEQHNVFGDIGCYTLGYYEPFNCIDACLEMGASVGMAVGASQAGAFPVVGVIGDSTFSHSGINGLVTAVKTNANVNIVVLDNDTTAMTGGQPSSLVGDALIKLVLGSGIDERHVRVLNPMPKLKEENVKALREEIEYSGPSVIVFRRPCIQVAKG